MAIQLRPLAASLGAEVTGVDLGTLLDPVTKKAIREAWLKHNVLFFRDQDLSIEQHKNFARGFGELHIHPVLQQLADQGHPEIVVLKSGPGQGYLASAWHSDVTFEREPPMGSILRAVEVPEAGGDTMFASMYSAYEALSDQMQRVVSGLRAVNSGARFQKIATQEQGEALAENEAAVHPVVRTHPETGRRSLFVNSIFTKRIEGMKEKESRALLEFLFDHIASPEFSCRFHWRPNSIAMWDNRCTQHRAVADNPEAPRHMQRVTLKGDVPR